MSPFSASDIVRLWEDGRLQHPLERALTMLAVACPEIERHMLATMTIGQRDDLLFELREQIFGMAIDGFTECPACTERLEFSLASAEIRHQSKGIQQNNDHIFQFAQGSVAATFRLPDSRDLAAVAAADSIDTACMMLLQRCVVQAHIEGKEVSVPELPDEAISSLAEEMAQCEPMADILLNLNCPSCTGTWQQSFDIASFFWAELAVQAKRLLREVHALASAYGWREAEILSMSDARRNCYLEMIS